MSLMELFIGLDYTYRHTDIYNMYNQCIYYAHIYTLYIMKTLKI